MRTIDRVMAKLRGMLPAFDEPPPEDEQTRIQELEARIAKLEALAKPKAAGHTSSGPMPWEQPMVCLSFDDPIFRP